MIRSWFDLALIGLGAGVLALLGYWSWMSLRGGRTDRRGRRGLPPHRFPR